MYQKTNSYSPGKRVFRVTSIIILFSLFCFENAYAYLDPGSGSFIVQIIIASLLSLVFCFRRVKEKIKVFFKRVFLHKPTKANE